MTSYCRWALDAFHVSVLLVMVGTGSLLVFIITIFGLGFSPVHRWLDTSEINWEYEKSNVDFDNEKDWYKWAGELKKEKEAQKSQFIRKSSPKTTETAQAPARSPLHASVAHSGSMTGTSKSTKRNPKP